MTIFLGRRLPDASSDLPGSRWRAGPTRAPARSRMLLPYLVLLPVGFAEPGRSPVLLVSSYLAVSPLPPRPLDQGGGLFSVALSLPESSPTPRRRKLNSDGGCYPPPRPLEPGLSSTACPQSCVATRTGRRGGHHSRHEPMEDSNAILGQCNHYPLTILSCRLRIDMSWEKMRTTSSFIQGPQLQIGLESGILREQNLRSS